MRTRWWSWFGRIQVALCVVMFASVLADAQGLGGAGTVQGTVTDPTGGVMVSTTVTISNAVSGFKRDTTTDQMGRFVFHNLAPNPYHVEVSAQGFAKVTRDVDVRSAVPIELNLSMTLAAVTSSVEVVGHVELVERDPTAHTDIDEARIAKLPLASSSGLNQVITLASPGVVSDANGFFHPIGDHAQTQFSIDNQPVTDQQSRLYSNQVSQDAVQSMEMITGVPPAEFGDKDSLVVRIITKSGLGQSKPMGSINFGMGSFKSPSTDFSIGVGGKNVGNFLSFSGLRTDRFLDSPEFTALHDRGNSQSLFDRVDLHPSDADSLHLNVQWGRSSFDAPNAIDQDAAGQDQHQKITSFNIAPGYTRVLSSRVLLAANAYIRRDEITYTASTDPFADQPGTAGQNRQLRNIGGKVDVSYSQGMHNVKVGGAVSATRLTENFTLGLTDPTANTPCMTAGGDLSQNTALNTTSQCAAASLVANPDFIPGLAPFDLSRGGALFRFAGSATIKEQSFYVQDEIKAGSASVKLGLRGDHYDGLSEKSLMQPRVGVSYAVPTIGTILRASYGRTMETPYNENLVLASSADAAVFGTGGQPLPPGTRDQEEIGVQQALGRWVVADLGYFHKHTTNGYDFGVLFDGPITFPVSWDHSKIDGITARLDLVPHGGFSAFTVLGHTNAIFSPPGTGGILLEAPPGDFRIDHDQKFQATTNVQYAFLKSIGAWGTVSWRYDSGLVAGAVGSYDDALALTGDQQAAIGLFCGGTFATPAAPLSSCADLNRGAKRLNIPADGAEDDVTNPPRIAPRHLFDLGFGIDNLLHTNKAKLRVRFTVINLTNKEALYNFLSTFSGTHFVTPRSYQIQAGVTF